MVDIQKNRRISDGQNKQTRSQSLYIVTKQSCWINLIVTVKSPLNAASNSRATPGAFNAQIDTTLARIACLCLSQYPDIFESATFSFLIRLPSTRIRRIRQRIRIFFNPLSTNTLRVDGEIFEPRKEWMWIKKDPDTCRQGVRTQVSTHY